MTCAICNYHILAKILAGIQIFAAGFGFFAALLFQTWIFVAVFDLQNNLDTTNDKSQFSTVP